MCFNHEHLFVLVCFMCACACDRVYVIMCMCVCVCVYVIVCMCVCVCARVVVLAHVLEYTKIDLNWKDWEDKGDMHTYPATP